MDLQHKNNKIISDNKFFNQSDKILTDPNIININNNDNCMIYAYLRVSTDTQNLQGNKSEILLKIHELNLNSQNIVWIEEVISGMKHWKNRELGDILQLLKPGDVFITSEISRIARSMTQIFEFISTLIEKGVKIYFTKSSFPVDGSISSQALIFAMSISAQIEREMISTRTRDALQRKKKEGVILGRPEGKMLLDKHLDEIKILINMGVKLKVIASKYNTTDVTMSRFVKKHKLKNK